MGRSAADDSSRGTERVEKADSANRPIADDRDPVEELADEFLERYRQGEYPSITEYVDLYPEHSDRIRGLFPTIAALEGFKASKERRLSDGRVSLGAEKLERLGDFRIIRELGRGGMGIVYEAEQESLERRVAVKVLPRQLLLERKHLQRFQREAQMAAMLHHTNIVPVFGVGEHDGYHYYVMQLIHGIGLDEVLTLADSELKVRRSANSTRQQADGKTLAALSSAQQSVESDGKRDAGRTGIDLGIARIGNRLLDPESVARIGLQSSNALHFAHEHGTLHRDIKPGNLLIDREAVVWVADFGLAKAIEQDNISNTEHVVGTLRYMAPEQFQGQADNRSDVYSLGLTLYELLTLQPAFVESDRNQLIEQIDRGAFAVPRKLNPRIPRNLETIILKAAARDPAHRYQTAGEMADDLQCFLNDEPIRARRASSAERVWRWCRRNRAVATLSGIAVGLLVLAAVVASIGYVKTSGANTLAQQALKGETQQRKRAEATSELALEALDKIFERFAPNRIAAASELTVSGVDGRELDIPVEAVLSKEAATLLQNLALFYDRLAEEGGASKFRSKAAQARRRVGDIHKRLGQHDLAIAAYQQTLEKYHRLDAASPDATNLQLEIAIVHNQMGNALLLIHKSDEARAEHRKARVILESVQAKQSQHHTNRFELARTLYFLAKSQRPQGDASNAADQQISEPLRVVDQDDEHFLRRSIALLESLVNDYRSIPDYRHLLAICYRDLAFENLSIEFESSGDHVRKATALLEELVEDFPDVPDYRYDLVEAYVKFPSLDTRQADNDSVTAEQSLMTALKHSQRLVAEHPNVPAYTISLVQVHFQIGRLLERRPDSGDSFAVERQLEQADGHFRDALELQLALMRRFPDTSAYQVWMAKLREGLARVLRRRGWLDESREILVASIRDLKNTLEGEKEIWVVHEALSDSYHSLAETLLKMDKLDLAADASWLAEEHRREIRGITDAVLERDRPPQADINGTPPAVENQQSQPKSGGATQTPVGAGSAL